MKISKMEISKFTVKTEHFTFEAEDGAVTVLINPADSTGSDNGLIGPIGTKEELVEQIKMLQRELGDVVDSILYPSIADLNVWKSVPSEIVEEVA